MENRSKSGLGDSVNGQQISRSLNFHGVVTDDNDRAVEGAAVVLFACYYGGVERSLGSAFTDRTGAYLILVPKPDYTELLGFKIRAGKAQMFSETSGNKSISQVDETYVRRSGESAIENALTDNRGKSSALHRRIQIVSGIAGPLYSPQVIRR
ncbi:MAG TPA: carboxypeptidase-like regulatory domain-containing protein [Spirochaetia bacterium]|nr:carboxypeptidase-like regulatory domain-containing protein [Spirochaetia bacterium]